MSKIKLSKEFIKSTVKLALNEDLYPSGDITSSLINHDKMVSIKLISNKLDSRSKNLEAWCGRRDSNSHELSAHGPQPCLSTNFSMTAIFCSRINE